MVANYVLDPLASFYIAAVIDAVGAQKNDVSWPHQCDLRDIRGVDLSLPERHRTMLVSVRMVFANLSAECGELREVIGPHRHKASELRRKAQRWRPPEMHKAELALGTYCTVAHGRNCTRLVVF